MAEKRASFFDVFDNLWVKCSRNYSSMLYSFFFRLKKKQICYKKKKKEIEVFMNPIISDLVKKLPSPLHCLCQMIKTTASG